MNHTSEHERLLSYRYYLIDLDRTLWNFDLNSEHAITMLVRRNPVLLGNILQKEGGSEEDALHRFFLHYDVHNHLLWAAYERGELSKDDLRWKRFHCTFVDYGVDDIPYSKEFGENYLEQMTYEKELMPGAMQMLQSIRSAGGRMIILSNGFKEVQYLKLERSGIAEFFSGVIVSEEVGCHKPSPEIFAVALERLSGIERTSADWKEAKRQALMIGDDLANDIEGAQIFGIDQYFYNHKGVTAPSGATYEHPDLQPFIKRTL